MMHVCVRGVAMGAQLVTAMVFAGDLTFNPLKDTLKGKDGTHVHTHTQTHTQHRVHFSQRGPRFPRDAFSCRHACMGG
jgi:aconitase A